MEEEILRRERVLLGIADQIASTRLRTLSKKRDGKSAKICGHYKKEREKAKRMMRKLEEQIEKLEKQKRKRQTPSKPLFSRG